MPRKKPTPELTPALLQEQRDAIDSVFPRERTYADLSDEELVSLFDAAFGWEPWPGWYEITRNENRIIINTTTNERFALWPHDGSTILRAEGEQLPLSNPFAFVRKCWELNLKY